MLLNQSGSERQRLQNDLPFVNVIPRLNDPMSPTVNKKTDALPETGFEEDEDDDIDEFEDLLEPVEEYEIVNYKILLKEETLKTNILRKVWQI